MRSFQPPVANVVRACSSLARARLASASSASSSSFCSTELAVEKVVERPLELKNDCVCGDGVVCAVKRPEELRKLLLLSSEHVDVIMLREEMPELLPKSRAMAVGGGSRVDVCAAGSGFETGWSFWLAKPRSGATCTPAVLHT